MIRDARLVAVEGAHASGKTTLVHALTARLKEAHVHVAVHGDVARESPLVEEAIVHGKGEIDLTTELQLFAAQLAGEQLLARHHELVLCDKSLLSVIAYSTLFLDGKLDERERELLAAMRTMSHLYAERYDAVFLLGDLYPLEATDDPHRLVEQDGRLRLAGLLAAECESAAVQLHRVPVGLSSAEKLAWVSERIPKGDAR